MKIKQKLYIFNLCMILLAFSNISNAAELTFPLEPEQIEKVVDTYSTDTIVQEEAAWMENQKIYSLTDASAHTIAFISSVGQESKGLLKWLLLSEEECSREWYDDTYHQTIEAALRAYDEKIDYEMVCGAFLQEYQESQEIDFEWKYLYDDVHIIIRVNDPKIVSVEVTIAIYNSEEYNPFSKDEASDDSAGKSIDYDYENDNSSISETDRKRG